MNYTRRDIAVMAYAFGLITGLVVAFASCSPPEVPYNQSEQR